MSTMTISFYLWMRTRCEMPKATRERFAERLGISVSTLSKVETGHGNVSKNVKLKIQN